jgi:hypothetical protein
MSKFYLLLDTSGLPVGTLYSMVLTDKSLAQTMNVGDKLLIAQHKGDDYDAVLPNMLKIKKLDQQKGWLILETEKTYDKKVSHRCSQSNHQSTSEQPCYRDYASRI